MRASQRSIEVFLAACILVASAAASAQTPATPYKPTVGMAGKDAVWVPTSEPMVQRMLDVAKVTPQDYVMDLGSGDGRTIIAAAKRGARALGVEFNADLVEFSKQAAAKAGVSDKAMFAQGDMYAADISKATVLALFLLPSNLEKLAPKFLDLRPGSRIVANTFWIEGWQADQTEMMQDNCDNWCTILLFVIPEKVAGKWRVDQGDLVLTQKFQMVEGSLVGANGVKTQVTGRLRGSTITLTVGQTEYTGQVANGRIEASTRAPGSPAKLVATKAP